MVGYFYGPFVTVVVSIVLVLPFYVWYRRIKRRKTLVEYGKESKSRALILPVILVLVSLSVSVPIIPINASPVYPLALVLVLMTLVLGESYSPMSFGFASQGMLKQLLLGAILFLIVGLVPTITTSILSQAFRQALLRNLNIPLFIFSFPFLAIMVALPEEALFRGYMQTKFSSKMGPWKAIALQGAFFGLWHIVGFRGVPDLGGIVLRFGLTFIPGLLYGVFFRYTRNLTGLVTFHALFDGFLGAVAPAGSGTPVPLSLLLANGEVLMAFEIYAGVWLCSILLLIFLAARTSELLGVLSPLPLGSPSHAHRRSKLKGQAGLVQMEDHSMGSSGPSP